MKCIIVDDDQIQRELLQAYIGELDNLTLAGSFENAQLALQALQDEDIDLLFLDVEMPRMSGLDLLKSLSRKPQIILVTSYEKYAVDAFDFDVTDFLVKPIDFARFVKAVNKASDRMKRSIPTDEDYDMFVKDGTQLIKINTGDIIFITALSDYVKIATPQKEYAILYTMKNILDKLPRNKFCRVHRSYIIRLDKIDKIEDHIIEIGDTLIPISKSYRDELYRKLNLLK